MKNTRKKSVLLLTLVLVTALLAAGCGNKAKSGIEVLTYDQLFIDTSAVPASLPVYKQAYPYGQEGPLFGVSKSYVDERKEILKKFLAFRDTDDLVFSEDYVSSGIIDCEVDGNSYMIGAERLSIMTSGRVFTEKEFQSWAKDNEVLAACLDWCGITDPVAVSTYQTDGTNIKTCQYAITNRTTDSESQIEAYNFRSVRVDWYNGTDFCVISFNHTLPETLGMVELIPIEDAFTAAKGDYDVAALEGFFIHYFENSDPRGYFPAYVFCAEDANGNPLQFEIPAVE